MPASITSTLPFRSPVLMIAPATSALTQMWMARWQERVARILRISMPYVLDQVDERLLRIVTRVVEPVDTAEEEHVRGVRVSVGKARVVRLPRVPLVAAARSEMGRLTGHALSRCAGRNPRPCRDRRCSAGKSRQSNRPRRAANGCFTLSGITYFLADVCGKWSPCGCMLQNRFGQRLRRAASITWSPGSGTVRLAMAAVVK